MNNFAISTDGLAEGLKRSASTLVAAGNSFEESIAMLAAGNKVVQDPETLGNALKVLSMRIRGTKTELEAVGEETDGLITNTSKLQSKIKALTNVDGKGGIDILTNTGDYRSTYEILLDIANIWEDIDDMEQAALLELLAGKTRGSQLAAILQNPEDLKDAYETALNSDGSAQRELDTFLDSIQGRIDLFTTAVQEMWTHIISSDFIKGIVDIGTTLIKTIDQVGVVGSSVLGMFGGFIIKNKVNLLDFVQEFSRLGQVINTGLFHMEPEQGGFIKYFANMFSTTELSKESSKVWEKLANTEGLDLKDKKAVKDKLEEALNSKEITQAIYAEIIAKKALSTENLTLGQTVGMLADRAKEFLLTNPVGQIMLVVTAITVAIKVFDWLTVSLEEQKEKLQETKKAYEVVESELKSLQDELKTTKDRIEELNAIDKLSFTEEEELRLLKEQNAELERKIYLKELEAKVERQKQDKEFVKTAEVVTNGIGRMDGERAYTKEDEFYADVERYKEFDSKYQQAVEARKKAEDEGNTAEIKKQERLIKQYETWRDRAGERAKTYKDELASVAEGVDYIKNPTTDLDKHVNLLLDSANDVADVYAIMIDPTAQASTYAFNRVAGKDEFADELKKLKRQGVQTGEQLRTMLSFNEDGTLAETNGDFNDFIQNLINCGFIADASAESLQRVADALYQTGQYSTGAELPTEFLSYDALAEKLTSYNTALVESQTILIEGQKVTEEYYNSLLELGITEDELSECIDVQNGYLVTNADELKGLLKLTKMSISSDAKLAKTQARLKYYNLYKELKKLTNSTGNYSDATRSQINSLYDQMNAIQKTIAQYSMLEVALLGATNAYTAYEDAQTIDEANNYNTQIESMFQTIANGFQTGKLGTEAVQSAMAAIIPPEFFENVTDADEAMQKIYSYFTKDLAGYVTIEFDDDGAVQSAEITKDNIIKFFNDVKKAGAFTGTIDEFDLSEGIDSMDDFVAKLKDGGMNITKEMAFAFLAEFEKYDISWLGGDYESLFDQLMGDNLEYKIHKNISALALLEQQLANGKITVEEYNKQRLALEKTQEANEKQAVSDAIEWYTLDNALIQAKESALNASKALQELDDSNDPAGVERAELQKQLDEANETIGYILEKKKELDEPTEYTITVADEGYEEARKRLSELKADIEIKATVGDEQSITLKAIIDEVEDKGLKELGIAKDAQGNWVGLATYLGQFNLDKTSRETISEIIGLIYGENAITLGKDEGFISTEQSLREIVDLLRQLVEEGHPVTITANDSPLQTWWKNFKETPWVKSVTTTVTEWFERKEIPTGTPTVNTPTSAAVGVNGTAHARGTAYKGGSWGAPRTETALVGELGPELLVRGSRWTTIGNNGAEFTDIRKGDIIFNHKQTEDLLSKGYVTGRGKAYASGTAYAGINTWFGGANIAKDYQNVKPSSSSSDGDKDKFEEVFDWIEVRIEEINEKIELLTATLENAVGHIAKNNIIDEIIGVNNVKLKNLIAGLEEYTRYADKLLNKVPAQYRDAVKNGSIAITEFAGEADEKTVEAINNYREWAQKAADLRQQIEELETEIADLAKQKFDNVSTEFENIISLTEAANDKLDAQISLMEDRGYVAAKEYYEAMAENTKDINAELIKERDTLQSVLDEQVKLGNIKVGSEAWYEMVQQMYDVDAAIVECTSDLESFQNAINDIYWDNFDELINRLGYLSDETQNLIDLMDEADMVFTPDNEDGWTADEVTWTEEGIASLGLYAQQMEIAEYQSKQYAKAIKDLNKDYKDGKYSESEYLDKLNELKNAQYDSIESYYDAQKAIKDLNQTRIDSIKKGIEKEIEAYDKLIKKKKEELDAEKDIHDFQKSVAEQQKNITEIQRKLAALSTDTSISAAAKRKQLEAELAQAQYELEEMYYDRSVSDKQDALDKELESFQEEKDKEIEQWEKYLEDIEQVVADSLGIVKDNASDIYDTLNNKANEYHLTLSESITSPWQDGALAVSDYQEVFDTAASSTMDQLEQIKLKWQEIIDVMSEKAEIEIDRQEQENNRYVAADNPTSKPAPTPAPNPTPTPAPNPLPSVGQTIRVKTTATHFSAQSGNAKMASFVPGGSYQVMQVGINGDTSQILIGRGSTYTGWISLHDIEGFASGTNGVKSNQLAWIDENDLEELVMHAGPDGRLQYLTKGTSVLNHTLTERIMDLAINPQEVLDRSRPSIGISPEIHNTEINLNITYGDILHIDEFKGDKPENLSKLISKEFDKHLKDLNQHIRRYSK